MPKSAALPLPEAARLKRSVQVRAAENEAKLSEACWKLAGRSVEILSETFFLKLLE